MTAPTADRSPDPLFGEVKRRTFLGYVLGGTTLVAAADLALAGQPASAAPSVPSVPEIYDLNDLLTHAAMPTANLITVTINPDGTASFALPRSENGQGIVTSTAMIIAEELELPVEKVHVTLADARPELLFNQLTGGSNTTISTYTPIRVAAAVAKRSLLEAGAIALGDTVGQLVARGGVIQGPSGTVGYGELAEAAASQVTKGVEVQLKEIKDYRVVGVGRGRTDALEAVTGRKTYTTDLQVPDALPTMVCRAPTLNGRPTAIRNKAAVLAMPGVTDVVMVDTGVAVRAQTFGQCIDAVRAVQADWADGTVAGLSDDDVVAQLRAIQVPMPPLGPILGTAGRKPEAPASSPAPSQGSGTGLPLPPLPTGAPAGTSGVPSAAGSSGVAGAVTGLTSGLTSGLTGTGAPVPPVAGDLVQQVTDQVEAQLSAVAGTVDEATQGAEGADGQATGGLGGALATVVESDVVFYFRSNSAMDTNAAVADVRADRAEIWAGLKSPGTAQARIAEATGLPLDKVTVHVVQGGGSFGRRLFFDGALEAAKISKAMGKPVKLMWHRADDARVGRTHPLATSRVQAVVSPATKEVLSFTQLHTSVETDYRHGLGDLITANATSLPPGVGNFVGFSQTVFTLTQEMPYDFGAVLQSLVEPDDSPGLAQTPRFNTSSMRNIYSPDVRTAAELTIDKIAEAFGEDAYEFRRRTLRVDRVKAVLDKVAEVGQWGKSMPAGTAQGIAIHKEYKGASACLVEIDCRPQTTGRTVQGSPEFTTGPRVTKVTYAIDAGLVINPRGLEAQMQGGINDGIAQALTSSLHLRDGHFLEASWDNYFYTRQWNTAPDVQVIIMPSDSAQPGGAGEAGVAASMAAVACAYARATGTDPAYFPVNHKAPLRFTPKPVVPPIPASPTDGLKYTV